MAMRLQLTSGIEILEEWAQAASQADRNVIYEALFSIADGSAFLVYDIFGDGRNPHNFVIVVKRNLVIKFNMRRSESSFELIYVGDLQDGVIAAAWEQEYDET
ncbi:DUF6235 family protein [Amycolatopsis sp. NPDC059027]|uniref:DUF6235 family protein n=1 Tax=unclassified Amycolatopsis TaxID=2618356 RepID=UPI00366D8EE3